MHVSVGAGVYTKEGCRHGCVYVSVSRMNNMLGFMSVCMYMGVHIGLVWMCTSGCTYIKGWLVCGCYVLVYRHV